VRSVVVLIVLAASVLGCKGKPKHRPPPQNAGAIDPNSKPTQSPNTEAPDIELPRGCPRRAARIVVGGKVGEGNVRVSLRQGWNGPVRQRQHAGRAQSPSQGFASAYLLRHREFLQTVGI